MDMPPKLGIVAGGTALPGLLARSAIEGGREVFIVALKGQAEPDVVETFDHAWVRMGAAGKALEHLRREGVEEIVLAGPVTRPTLGELVPDGRALNAFLRPAPFPWATMVSCPQSCGSLSIARRISGHWYS